jgi:hypothetical protein
MTAVYPVSTVPTVLANLLPMIEGQVQPGPSGGAVLVCYGDTGMYAPGDIIQINTNVRRTVKPEVFIGSYAMDSLRETYDIEVLASSWSGSPNQLDCMNRAYELVGYVEVAVRTNPTCGASVVDAHPSGTSGGAPTLTQDPTGWMSEITVTISVVTLN